MLEDRIGLSHFNEWKYENHEFHEFDACTRQASLGRKFAITKKGYMALVPP